MVKPKFHQFLWIGLLLLISSNFAFTTSLADDEASYITAKIAEMKANRTNRMICAPELRCSLALTSQFYQAESSAPIWSQNGKPLPIVNDLLLILKKSYTEGLNPNDYHVDQISNMLVQFESNITMGETRKAMLLADLDVTLSDAFLLYARHMAYGKVDTMAAYPRWIITKRTVNLSDLLIQAAKSRNINEILKQITPRYIGYIRLRSKLNEFFKLTANNGWESIPAGLPLKLGATGKRVAILKQRLAMTGYLESTSADKDLIFDKATQAAVAEFQKDKALRSNGIVDQKTLQALNIPLDKRIKLIELNMDRLRWLPLNVGQRYVLVNIPNFSLDVIENNEDVLSMPVIVGKEANRSCVLSSKINYLELNPYWNLPNSIVVREILPILRRNPGYLDKDQIRVYNSNGDEIDPYDVDWNMVTARNLALKFRQEPGTKNALGRVKFIFPNNCGIYLHDTPSRQLFSHRRRDFSHGCIRIGKPIEFADYLLADKPSWDEARIESQIESGRRQVVTLANPIDVHIIYATAWIGEDGLLKIRHDIYGIDDVNYPIYIPNTVNQGSIEVNKS